MKFAGVKSPKRRVSGVSGTSHLTFSAVPSASSFRFSGALAKRSSFSLTVGGVKNCSSPCPPSLERVVDFGRVRRSPCDPTAT